MIHIPILFLIVCPSWNSHPVLWSDHKTISYRSRETYSLAAPTWIDAIGDGQETTIFSNCPLQRPSERCVSQSLGLYHAFTHHSPWCLPAVVRDDSRPCIAHITFQPIIQQLCNSVDLWVKWNLLSQSWIALQHGIAVAKPADIMKSVDSHINNEYSKGSVKVIRHRYKLDPL